MTLPTFFQQQSLVRQSFMAIFWVLAVAGICFWGHPYVGYRSVALILLFVVSLTAMVFDIIPVLLAAVLSALIWDYFFIPPLYTLVIQRADDFLMFLSYFFIALLNAIMNTRIRKAEKHLREKEEKENTIKLYNTLLHSLSHELKTPISTIMGAVEHLQNLSGQLNEKQRNALLQQMDVAALRLNRQVENLLNMSRLDTGTLHPKMDWCDVNEMVYACIQKLGPLAQHTVLFVPDEQMPYVKLDHVWMEQILYNLLHNAVQYTPPGSVIEVQLSQQDGIFVLAVSDDGPGIPKEAHALVFEKFFRLPHAKTGGSGLGLSIVKGFVEALNGTITIQTRLPKGLTFVVKIPAAMSFVKNIKHD